MDADRIDALVSATAGRIGAAWAAMVSQLRDQNSVEVIAQRIESGRDPLAGVFDASKKLAAGFHGAYIAAGQTTAKWVNGELSKGVVEKKGWTVFDAAAPPSVEWAKQNDLSLITEVDQETRDTIRAVLVRGAQNGTPPAAMAREIRGSIGLTDYQNGIVENYRRQLEQGQYAAALDRELSHGQSDRVIAAAQRKEIPLTQAQIDTAVERYRANMIAFRANAISRTESTRVAHQGSDELYRQAIERGDLDPDRLQQEWHTSHLKNMRDSHRVMDGQKRPFGEPFTSGAGIPLIAPGDPSAPAKETANCACTKTTRLLPARGGERTAPREDAPAPAEIPEPPIPVTVLAPASPPTTLPHPAPAHAQAQPTKPPRPAQPALARAKVEDLERLGGGDAGINQSYVAELDDGEKAIWKPASGEAGDDLRTNIKEGTYYKREAAAYSVRDILGVGDMVPETVAYEHDGQVGSLQRWVKTASPSYDIPLGTKFDRRSSEQMRVFDFVTGNSDRHMGNVLFEERDGAYHPVLIDNGLAFPNGVPDKLIQPSSTVPQAAGVLPETVDQINAIDLDALAERLADSDIEPEAIRHTLYRARTLQLDPAIMRVPDTTEPVMIKFAWDDAARDVLKTLPTSEIEKINAIVARLTRRKL